MFVEEIIDYIEDETDLVVNTNLLIGEIQREKNAVYAVQAPGEEPNKYVPTESLIIDFWSVDPDSEIAYDRLREIKNLLHRRSHYLTSSYRIDFSNALGNIEDMDRDGENRKMWRLTMRFVTLVLVS